jgi:DHA1 family multidrug resistance protein-like MFS transporter
MRGLLRGAPGARKPVWMFFAVTVLFNMAANFAHPVTPTLFQQNGYGDYLFGYALAALLTANFLFSPFWGRMNSLISSRWSFMLSTLGYALGQVGFTLATTEPQVLAARFFAGVFSGGAYVSMLNYVVNIAPSAQKRGVWLTASATIQSVAGAFGYFAGGMLGSLGVTVPLWSQIICLAASAVLIPLVCHDDAVRGGAALSPRALLREANPFATFIQGKQFMSLTLAAFFALCALHNLGQVAFDQSFNYYIRDVFELPSTYNGTLKAAMGMITLIANATLCAFLLRRTDVRKSLAGLFALCAVTMGITVQLSHAGAFMTVNVFFYAFAAICVPLIQTVAASAASGRDSNLIMGFYNALKSLGGIIGAAAAGTLYTFSPTYPFICAMIAFALAAALGVWYFRRSRREEAETASN